MTAPVVAAAALIVAIGFTTQARGQALPGISEVMNGHTERVTYRGVNAVKLVPAPETAGKDDVMMAILDGPTPTSVRSPSRTDDGRIPASHVAGLSRR